MRFRVTSLVVMCFMFAPWCARGQQAATAAQTNQSAHATAAKARHAALEYVNTEYGFRLELPASWKGYKVVQDKWSGSNGTDQQVEQGPMVVVQNPRWTFEHPTQDIPIMVFTLAQWKRVANDELFVSAAPIGPGELGRNQKYVFALPPRFTYPDADEKEEVEKLVQGHPLHAF